MKFSLESLAASRGELWMSKKCEIDWPSCPRNEALCMAVLWHSYSRAGLHHQSPEPQTLLGSF